MFFMLAVASVCAVVLIAGLMRLACRHRKDLWIVSDDAILCLVAPAIILLSTFGASSLGYRITHGGLAAVPAAGWIGSLVIAAVFIGAWLVLAPRMRAGAPK